MNQAMVSLRVSSSRRGEYPSPSSAFLLQMLVLLSNAPNVALVKTCSLRLQLATKSPTGITNLAIHNGKAIFGQKQPVMADMRSASSNKLVQVPVTR